MNKNPSPLRYPGGKYKIAKLIKMLVFDKCSSKIFVEPFVGGAGVSLFLLENNFVERVILNDLDISVYSIWKSLLENSDWFANRIESIDLNISEWKKQKEIYLKGKEEKKYSRDFGFACFYLNRTCFSGMLHAGPLGGYDQHNPHYFASHFNRKTLSEKVRKIGSLKDKITIYNLDFSDLVQKVLNEEKKEDLFLYFDPPYFIEGSGLYKQQFDSSKHCELKKLVENLIKEKINFCVSYDDCDFIGNLYLDILGNNSLSKIVLSWFYQMKNRNGRNELLYLPPNLVFSSEEIEKLKKMMPKVYFLQ